MKAAGAQIDDDFGKSAVFSTYTPAGQVLQNPQAKAVVRRFIPMVAMLTDDIVTEISAFNLRELAKMHGRLLRLSSKKLDKIDRALSEIPLVSKNSLSTASESFDEHTQVLKGNQITQIMAKVFFTRRDCAAMLDSDLLKGEANAAPRLGDEIIRDSFSTAWQIQRAGPDGFRFKELTLEGPQETSASYMSFYLNSPQDLDNLLVEPNVPKLYLNLETACCLQVLLNGKEIFIQKTDPVKSVKSQIPLLLGRGSNHILIKVVKMDTDFVVKAFLTSSHEGFIEKLTGQVKH
jgi:hypothetical protein